MGRIFRGAVLAWAALAAAGCVTRQPVLYPNPHLQAVGPGQAREDVDACVQSAKDYGLGTRQAERVAGRTAERGTLGAAAGAAGGAVAGSAARGASIGAAAGATAGLVRGLFRSTDPDPLHKSFVRRCLRDRGYEVLGWR